MTGLNGTQVEPLNRLCPFWACGEPSAKTPQPPWPLFPRCRPLWYRYRSPTAAVLLVPSVMAVMAYPTFWLNGPLSRRRVT